MPLFLLAFFPSYVQKAKWGKLVHAVHAAMWFAIGVLAVLYVILLGSFGSRSLTTMKYPAITLMSSIHLRGSFLKRLDAFMIAIWFFTLFALVTVFLFYAQELVQKLRKKIRIKMVSLWGDGCRFRGWQKCSTKAAMGNGSGIICCISESRCFCSCHCLYFCGERGKNGMKGKIKKYVALVLSVQQLLCGCSATELEDRCFPMMAVVDEKDGQISFGYGFPKLSQKDNTDLEEARVNIAPVTGKTMESCVQTYDSGLEKLADCNHMKVLVFGENLMEDTGRYADVLSYLKQTGLFPRNIYVCVAEDPLALFETEEDLPQDLGSYLEQYLQNQESAGSGKLFKLGRLLDEKENHILQIMLPYLETEDHIIFWKTMYRVPDDRFLYKQEK